MSQRDLQYKYCISISHLISVFSREKIIRKNDYFQKREIVSRIKSNLTSYVSSMSSCIEQRSPEYSVFIPRLEGVRIRSQLTYRAKTNVLNELRANKRFLTS